MTTHNLVYCSCPGCDGIWSLEKWTITPDGLVYPSVDHSKDHNYECSFHDMIRLEGYRQ